jgi:hypothetical protein
MRVQADHTQQNLARRLRPRIGLPLAIAMVASTLPLALAQPASAVGIGAIDTSNRAAVAAAFNANYALDAPAPGWTGSRTPCASGSLSTAYRDVAFTRLNLYRALAGVPSSVAEDATYTAQAQAAALIRARNQPPVGGRSPHDPDPASLCYTNDGHTGSASGNLYWESGAALDALEVMDGWMDDHGVGNLGHRVWMLHPPIQKAGYGDVPQSVLGDGGQVLVVQDHWSASWPSVSGPSGGVAWPPKGYVPHQLVYRDWSLTLKGADLRNATVTMAKGGQPLGVTKISGTQSGGVPESTLVWQPDDCEVAAGTAGCAAVAMPTESYSVFGDTLRHTRPSADTNYDVTISNVVIGGTPQTITYRTTVIDPATSGSGNTGGTPTNGGGTTTTAGFEPVSPVRILDTRAPGMTRLAANTERQVTVAGANGIPANAGAAAVNVTAVAPAGDGWLRVYPCGSMPEISNLNFVAGQTVPNAAVVGLSAGKLCVLSSVATNVIIDVGGYQVPGGTSKYSSLSEPIRILDTRNSNRVGAGQSIEMLATGGGVPSSAVAVTINLTATGVAADGFVTAYPCGTAPPNASSLNPEAGGTRPNLVIVKLGVGGKVCFFSSSATHLIVDVAGWWGPAGTASFVALTTPARVWDSRNSSAVAAGSVSTVSLGVPANAAAVQLNVTAVEPRSGGFFTVFPADVMTVPGSSNVNFDTGEVVPNAVVVRPVNGKIKLYTSAGSNVIVDVLGYYTG